MELKAFVRANADRVLAGGLVIVGAIAVIIGWVGASGTGLAVKQIPYLISGGIGGVVMIVIGCALWVSADLQDEWRRLAAIEEQLERLASTRRDAAVATTEVATAEDVPAEDAPAEDLPAAPATNGRSAPAQAARKARSRS